MTLHVACAAAGAYVPHSAAVAHSALAHGDDVVVHYLHGPSLDARARRWLRHMSDRIVLHEIAPERLAGLPVHGYFTAAMWYRLLLPELVEADRVLYLDCDAIVVDRLAPLLEVPLEGALVAAVDNVPLPWLPDRARELGLASYFNSGVLLLALDALRTGRAMEEVAAFARAEGEQLVWPDQDALNVVLGQRRVPLSPRWNAMNAVLERPEAEELFGAGAVAEARERPAIRHFEGPGTNKPWEPGFDHPHGERYWVHRQATPFRSRRRAFQGLIARRPL